MLAQIYPRYDARCGSLLILGPHLNGFARWLRDQGYPPRAIGERLRATKHLEAMLRQRGVGGPGHLTVAQLLRYAPKAAQDRHLSALVRSLVKYFEALGILAPTPTTPTAALVAAYQDYMENVRGLSVSTVKHHTRTVVEFLASVGYEQHPGSLAGLNHRAIEEFLRMLAQRHARPRLQQDVAQVRAVLRFLAARNLVEFGLDTQIDTPRVYRGEQLPRALPWEVVRALLQSIDRSTPMGRRDYAMLLLVATYGLRTCEVAALSLDDIEWRASRLRVRRSKVDGPLILPLTPGVGAAVLDYLRHGRPELPFREVFLRAPAPAGPLKPTTVTAAFRGWVRRSGLPIRFQGAHCVRHSLATHLLRQGTPLKAIGDLLGHRSPVSTSVYLRLQIEDLRDVALPLPTGARR